MKERSTAHNAIFNTFNATDPRSFAVYKFLEDIYPSFAEKLFKNNLFMERIVMSNYNPIDILDYPICGRCETLAAWDGVGKKQGRRYRACSCFATGCGQRTINPVTLRVWMNDELKKKAPPALREVAEEITDQVALGLLHHAQRHVDDILVERRKELNAKMGMPEPDTEISHEYIPKTSVSVKEGKLSENYSDMIDEKTDNIIEAEDVYMEDDDNV